MTTTTAAPIAVPDTFHGDQYLSLTALFSIAGGRPVADDSGAPKSMLYGSHQRSVLTSASLRRAERTHSRHLANNGHGPLADAARGIRTRELAIMVANQLHDLGWDSEDASVDAMSIARSALSGMGLKFGAERTANLTKVLLFIPPTSSNGTSRPRKGATTTRRRTRSGPRSPKPSGPPSARANPPRSPKTSSRARP